MNCRTPRAYFIDKTRDNLHVVLAMSPIGDAFRERLRQFPSLVNCCTIDWWVSCRHHCYFARTETGGRTLHLRLALGKAMRARAVTMSHPL